MKKRKYATILGVSSLMLLLAACGDKEETKEEVKKETAIVKEENKAVKEVEEAVVETTKEEIINEDGTVVNFKEDVNLLIDELLTIEKLNGVRVHSFYEDYEFGGHAEVYLGYKKDEAGKVVNLEYKMGGSVFEYKNGELRDDYDFGNIETDEDAEAIYKDKIETSLSGIETDRENIKNILNENEYTITFDKENNNYVINSKFIANKYLENYKENPENFEGYEGEVTITLTLTDEVRKVEKIEYKSINNGQDAFLDLTDYTELYN